MSQMDEEANPVIYPDGDGVLKSLVDTFPRLVSIDVSGTNLAGFEPPESVSHSLRPERSVLILIVEKAFCQLLGYNLLVIVTNVSEDGG